MAFTPELPMIFQLRSTLVFYRKVQQPDLNGTGTIDSLQFVAQCRAMVTPLVGAQFIGGTQLDESVADVTHEAFIRWIKHSDIFDFASRNTYEPDGTVRTETFRVVKCMDYDQQRRFMKLFLQIRTDIDAPTN